MIEVFASQPHYVNHLAPVVRMLDSEARMLVTSEELLAYARDLGCPNIAIGVPRHAGPPTLVAGYRDADWTFSGRRLALLEHGVGQTYRDVSHKAYAGGPDWERLSLVLSPGPHAAKHWRHFYPGLKVVEVGVPKLDRWCYVRDRPQHDPQVVAFAFHWPCKQTAETWPAFDDWADRIAALPRDRWTLLGHWHPRWGDTLRRWYSRHDIEPVERFDQVLDRADLLVADNTSVMYEFAAVGRPVLCLEESRWRHDVEHGLRFWSYPPGITAGDALPLEDYIDAALADDPHSRELRTSAVASAYGTLADGQATSRAVEALRSWM